LYPPAICRHWHFYRKSRRICGLLLFDATVFYGSRAEAEIRDAPYVRELIKRSQVKRINLGCHAENISQDLIRLFELPKAGVKVAEVAPRSLSEKAGLRVGDIVYAIGAANSETQSIRNAGELNDALAFLAEEKQLKLYFIRISQQ
jgi:S1-C subfamily serine protease